MRRAAVGVLLIGLTLWAVPAGAKTQKLTVKQVASAVAELRPDIFNDLANVEADCGPVIDCSQVGHIELVTLKARVETLDLNFDSMIHPSKTVARSVPKSLRPLVVKTRAALVRAGRATNTVEACYIANPADSCVNERLDLSFSGSDLRRVLLGWDAYL